MATGKKFSEFVAGTTMGAGTSFLVGYDTVGNTNNKWSKTDIAGWLGTDSIETIFTDLPEGTVPALQVINLTDDITFATTGKLLVGEGDVYGWLQLQPASTTNGDVHRLVSGESDTILSKLEPGNTLYLGNEDGTDNSYGFNMGAAPTTTSSTVMTIKAQGTSTNKTLVIQDSSAAETFSIQDDGVAKYSGQAYTEQHGAPLAGFTVNWNNGNVQYIQLASGANTFTPSNPQSGATYILQIKQPSAGAAGTMTWGSSVKWPAGTEPTWSTANDAIDVVTLIYNGTTTHYYAVGTINLS